MKRFLLAVLFFAGLDCLWEWAFRAKIWSPVLVAVAAAGGGISEDSGRRWHAFAGDRHYNAPAAHRLCHRHYWWVAAWAY